VARALGADEGVLCGDCDHSVIDGVGKVSELWGGDFKVSYEASWKKFLQERKREGWKVAHLTMYGEDFAKGAKSARQQDCVVVVGAGKVPGDVYRLADWNLSVTGQPHSEVGALALFLDRYHQGKELELDFRGKLSIIPSARRKTVVERK
jgi:tRNA (cytidine56-2'-O)-methyltransferase